MHIVRFDDGDTKECVALFVLRLPAVPRRGDCGGSPVLASWSLCLPLFGAVF